MRRWLAILLVIGNTVLIAQTGSARPVPDKPQGKRDVRQNGSNYRGKPLSFYLTEARTPALRAEALRAIGSFGSDAATALPQLVESLQDSEVQVRIAAGWAISQIAPSSNQGAVSALATTLSDSDPRVRSMAAVALRQIGPGAANAIPQLIVALDDSVAFVRAPAADALGAMGPAAKGAVGPLAKRLGVKDEQIFVLRSISYALGNIGPDASAALPALEEAFKIVRVSYAAQSAMLKIKGQPVASY